MSSTYSRKRKGVSVGAGGRQGRRADQGPTVCGIPGGGKGWEFYCRYHVMTAEGL